MIRTIMCLLLITAWAYTSQAQNNSNSFNVSGKVLDQNSAPLVGATIVLLQPEDSVMAGYSITNVNGEFQIRNINPGEFIMQIAYLGFVDRSETIKIEQSTQLDTIILTEDARQLDAVEISADHIPIMLKKDTIEYNSAAFATQINDKVEELLRQLPGVEIEEDGTIKAQGEEVQKILVDGKEFFGDDPKIASKNLPADAVDKVQVFDKLSELAEFTGIDDGERSKTINLTLKGDHKNGMFGDVAAGYGTDQRYLGKASLNRFDEKSQMSILASANNTNEQNFSIDDYINFAGGLQGLAGGGGRINLSMDDIGMTPSAGITSSQSVGVNFNHDFSKRTLMESNYFFTGIQNVLDQSNERENKIENGTYLSSQQIQNLTDNFNHRLNFRIKHDWNNQDLTMRGNVKSNLGSANNSANGITYNTNGEMANTNEYLNTTSGTNTEFNSSLMYRNRINDKGRSLVINMNLGNEKDDLDSDQSSINTFVNDQFMNSEFHLNQVQDQSEFEWKYGATINFTEPLGGRKYLSLSHVYSASDISFSKAFLDIDTTGIARYNNDLSNVYERTYSFHRSGVRFLWSRDRSKTTVGLEAQNSSLDGTFDNESSEINRGFFNILPSLRWSYEPTSSRNLEVGYRTSISAPSVTQLQPFIDNSNPLRLYVGNPNLSAEYRHMVNLNYRLFDMFNFTSLFLSLRGIYTKDKITNSSNLTEDFVQVLTPINVTRDIMINSFASFGTPIRSIGAKINLEVNSTYNRGIQVINGLNNDTDRWINAYDFNIENRKKTVLDLRAGLKLARNFTYYSDNERLNQQFSQLTYYGHFKLNFSKRWTLNSTFDYQTYHGDSFSSNMSIPLLSAYISRTFLKYDRAQLKLYVFDLLDKNTGINRVNDFNYVEDQRYNAMQRYFMFSLTYTLSKFGKSTA